MPSPFWVHIILPLLAEIFMPHLASVPYLVSGIASFHTLFSLASFSDNLVQTFFFLSFFLLFSPLFGFWWWSFSRDPWTCWQVTMTHPSLDFFGPGISSRGDWLWQERGCIYSLDHIALISMKVSRPNECDTDSIVLLQDGTEQLPTAHNSK